MEVSITYIVYPCTKKRPICTSFPVLYLNALCHVYFIIISVYTISFKTSRICARSTRMKYSSNYVCFFECYGCLRLYWFFANLSILSLLITDYLSKSKSSQENEGCCVLEVYIFPLLTLLLDIGTVPKQWYIFLNFINTGVY